MRTRLLLISASIALLIGGPATARAAELPLRPIGAKTPMGDERLSNELTITRSANTNLRAKIHSEPSDSAKVVGRLRYHTEDGPPEVYLLLESKLVGEDQIWIKIRIPARPNGQTGWVKREALTPFSVTTKHLVISRKTLRAKLFRDGKLIFIGPVGVGKKSTPTPAGDFYAREKLKALQGGTIYGPWAIGTSAYSSITDWPGGGVVGVHGTNQPELIPGRPSHGCVRMPNRKISKLVRLMPIGTPITIK